MKKSLIALAALAAVSAASAQSTVTLYGVIDVASTTKTHTSGTGVVLSKTTGIGEGFNAGNRIGFKGTEDLGGGLKANFVIEQGINITNGALFGTRSAASGQQVDGYAGSGNMPNGAYSTGTNRQSYVGASGAFGEVRLGYQYTALYSVSTLNGYHVGSEQPGGDLAHGTLSNASFGGTRANGITYIAPKIADITVTVQKGAGTGREDVVFSASTNAPSTRAVDKSNRWSIQADYANGPLKASYAHTSYKQEQSQAASATGYATTIFGSLSATQYTSTSYLANNYTNTLDQLGGSYVLGNLKLVASMANGSVEDSVTSTNTVNTRAKQIGAEYTIGAARPFVTVGTGTVTTDSTGAKTFDGKLSQFGVRYDLSKRTTAYFMTGSTKDETAATVASATLTAKRKATAIGIAHSF